LGRDRAAELTADRLVYRQGQVVQLRVRFLDESLLSSAQNGVTVVIEQMGSGEQQVELAQLPQSPTVFDGQVRQLGVGTYHARVTSPSFRQISPSTDFRIEPPVGELQTRSIDSVDLARAAELTHGHYYSIGDAAQLPDDIPQGRPVPLSVRNPLPLWNRWELLLLFALTLLAEWLLRKRARLL
jgi:hypothetical protein